MCHVLIIEDERLIALDIEGILSELGATSFAFAETEAEAVAAAEERAPAVITTDVVLKEGSGVAAIARIEAQLGPMAVIFITATPDEVRPPRAGSPVLRKPLNESAVAEAFRDMWAAGAEA